MEQVMTRLFLVGNCLCQCLGIWACLWPSYLFIVSKVYLFFRLLIDLKNSKAIKRSQNALTISGIQGVPLVLTRTSETP